MTVGRCSETETVDIASFDSSNSLLDDDLPEPRLGLVEAKAECTFAICLSYKHCSCKPGCIWGFLNLVSKGVNCSFSSDFRERCEVTVFAAWFWALQVGFSSNFCDYCALKEIALIIAAMASTENCLKESSQEC